MVYILELKTVQSGAFKTLVEALKEIRRLFDFLPLNNKEKSPIRKSFDKSDREDFSLDTLIPENPNSPYDMKELILKLADETDFYEIQKVRQHKFKRKPYLFRNHDLG